MVREKVIIVDPSVFLLKDRPLGWLDSFRIERLENAKFYKKVKKEKAEKKKAIKKRATKTEKLISSLPEELLRMSGLL
jgi:hypothetical protein